MPEETAQKLAQLVIVDPEEQVLEDLAISCLRLAHSVERYTDGDYGLEYIDRCRPQIAVLSLDSWHTVEQGLSAVKICRKWGNVQLVVTHRKMLPKHLGRLRRMRIKHIVGHPLDPLYLYRIANEHFGVIARRFDRVGASVPVFLGAGPLKEVIGNTRDISRGGIMLMSELKLTMGDSLFFGLELGPGYSIEARGEIVSMRPGENGGTAYGIAFNRIPTQTSLMLNEAVKSLEIQSRLA